MTQPEGHRTILGNATYTPKDERDYYEKLWAAEAGAPSTGREWIAMSIRSMVPKVLYDMLSERKSDTGNAAGRIAIGEGLEPNVDSRHERTNSWRNASEYVARSERLVRPRRIGGRAKVPHAWLMGHEKVDMLVEPREYISNTHNPERLVSLPALCGKRAVYTNVKKLDVVANLFNVEENPSLIHDVAVFPPFTRRAADNFLKSPAKRKAGAYTQLAAMLRVRDGNTIIQRRMERIYPSECTEPQATALEVVAKQTYEELAEARRDFILGRRPPQGRW